MKKLINLLLLMTFVCAGALPARAYDVTVMVDDASSVKFVRAAFETSLGSAGTAINLSNGLNTPSVSDKFTAVRGTSYNKKPAVVKANGEDIDCIGDGSRLRPYYYKVDLSKYSEPILIEIYYSSSTATYQYDLSASISDESSHITSFKNTTSNTTYTSPLVA